MSVSRARSRAGLCSSSNIPGKLCLRVSALAASCAWNPVLHTPTRWTLLVPRVCPNLPFHGSWPQPSWLQIAIHTVLPPPSAPALPVSSFTLIYFSFFVTLTTFKHTMEFTYLLHIYCLLSSNGIQAPRWQGSSFCLLPQSRPLRWCLLGAQWVYWMTGQMNKLCGARRYFSFTPRCNHSN